VRVSHTIPLAEINRIQADRHRSNQETGTADLDRCGKIDLSRYHDDYAALISGNPYDTIKTLAVKLWCSERGALTRGDLLWLCHEIDEATGRWQTGSGLRTLTKMIEWIAREVSPFPIPQSLAEKVDRAMTWAKEKVEPLKRKRHMKHRDLFESTFITSDALQRYAKQADEYKLACSICAIGVKHDALPESSRIVAIIEEVAAHFAASQDISEHETL
jgi:hypothetical protein